MKDWFDYWTHETAQDKAENDTDAEDKAMKKDDWEPTEGDLEAHNIENEGGRDELLIMEYGNVDGWISSKDAVEVRA